MFKKLRNKLILINLSITTVVILTAFSAIYVIATKSADGRPPIPDNKIEFYSDDVENIILVTINNEKQAAARDLLALLIVSGVAIEITVAIVSYFLAEEAIKPVKEAYNAQKVFIANASHEIKTPLAAIAANLEAADIHGNKWIKNVERETEKLTALNGELLTLARTDLVTESKVEEVNLRELVLRELESLEPRMKNISFTRRLAVDGKVKINAPDFTQILGILMDNAIKYNGGKIRIEVTPHDLTVANNGAKISTESLKHIFDRFYQVDKTADGVGLGLAIAKSLAERNHWVLTAESNNNETKFKLKY